ncbi:MAG: ABC transporter ATP-binding protein [bacterium]|nr:ABC transporter ATP-binding protein [bacterium]
MSETLVNVEHLSKKFCRRLKRSLWYGVKDIGAELTGIKRNSAKLRKDEFWALKDVDFEIKKGELVGLIGANGAGKTTLLKALSGLIKPDEGQITIRGKIQALIALGAGFNPILTGRENVYVNGAILGFTKKEMDALLDDIMDFSDIGEFIDMPVQSYSSGMQVRLGFSVAVNLKPDILIVDEVLAVGDASFRRKARNKMMDLLHSGISVLFVSHNMAMVSSLTSRCIYLEKGRVKAVGPSDEVTSLYLSDSIKRSKGVETHDHNWYMASAYVIVPDIFQLKNVKTADSEGVETVDFKTFDHIHIKFQVEFLEPMKNILFAFSIREQVDDVVLSAGKFRPENEIPKGTLTIQCRIDKNRFREGNYNIGFYVSDYDGGSLYKSHNVATLSILAGMDIIRNTDSLLGFMVMDTTWRLGE